MDGGQDVEYGSPNRESISISPDLATFIVEWRNDSSGDATLESVPIEQLINCDVSDFLGDIIIRFKDGLPVRHVPIYGSKKSARRFKNTEYYGRLSFILIAHSNSSDERERLLRATVHLVVLVGAEYKSKHAADSDPFK